jgi:hypothetical protein
MKSVFSAKYEIRDKQAAVVHVLLGKGAIARSV